jgi:hypothetical protein
MLPNKELKKTHYRQSIFDIKDSYILNNKSGKSYSKKNEKNYSVLVTS